MSAGRKLRETGFDGVADGCLLPTLARDAMRGASEARQIFGEQIMQVVERNSQPATDVSRESFWAILALMAGGVLLARAVENEETAEEIFAACRRLDEDHLTK